MCSDSVSAFSGLVFYRRSRGLYLAIGASLAGIAGVILGFWGPAPRLTDKGLAPSLALLAAGAGLACICAAVVLNFLWGLTNQGRFFAILLTALPIAFSLVFLWPPQQGAVAAAAVALCGAALFFYEKGLTLEFGPQGARRVRLFPWRAQRTIPWDKLESVITDMRRVTTYGAGDPYAESENRLVLIGDGRRLSWDTLRYEAVREDLINQIEKAAPFAIAATISCMEKTGLAQLGPIEVRKDELVLKGFSDHPVVQKSPLAHLIGAALTCGLWLVGLAIIAIAKQAKPAVRVPLESISYAAFEKGSLLIAAGQKYYFPLRRIPNGYYFPDLLDEIFPRASASQPANEAPAQGV